MTRKPDFSDRRRETVLSMLREHRTEDRWHALSRDSRLLYVLGALLCDDAGCVPEADVGAAWRDPFARTYAQALITEAGA